MTVGAISVRGSGFGWQICWVARKLLGDLMPAECTEQDRNIFLPRPRFRASGGVGDLDNGANRESVTESFCQPKRARVQKRLRRRVFRYDDGELLSLNRRSRRSAERVPLMESIGRGSKKSVSSRAGAWCRF